jgi:SAM-dependent methyltransferase/GT2 family glycosyltransferase
MQLASFSKIHQDETIVVCGCGESLSDFAESERFITIGVNDVGRRFQPNYLVVVNPKHQFSAGRFHYVETSRAEYLFTQLDLGVNHPNVVKFQLGESGGTDFSNLNVLHYTNNSPYIALCLAIRMGAKRVGLIGVDFTDRHFFAESGRHPLAPQFEAINEQYARLAKAAKAFGVEIFNLSGVSRLTAFPKISFEEFEDLSKPEKKRAPLKIVSYATTPVAGVPSILARCIAARTEYSARCVWATNNYGNGVSFAGDLEWGEKPEEAESLLAEADFVIVHNGKIDLAHEKLLENKPILTMAHNYLWNVDERFVRKGFPGVVVGQYQATLPEFRNWAIVPNPIPLWEAEYRTENKPERTAICFTPFGRHDIYAKEHRLYWHSKGCAATVNILENLARRFDLKLEITGERQISHAESLAMKRRSHIVIDECVTGSYHRNSLEGLAAGCVVVNGIGKLPQVVEKLFYCAGQSAENPFVSANLDELEDVLAQNVEKGAQRLAGEGLRNRKWMEKNWDFAVQWRKFWQPVLEKTLHRAANRTYSKPAVLQEKKIDFASDSNELSKQIFYSKGEISTMTIARNEDLNLPEFAAFNEGQNYPMMRRWELPFALFQMRLSGFMSVLDCTINPVNFRERMLNLYPNVVYRHWQPVQSGQFILPFEMPDEAFDRVVCVNTLEHLFEPQREALLAEMARKLKPGGLLIITCDQYPEYFWEKPELLRMGLVRADGQEVFNGFNKVSAADLIETNGKNGLHPIGEDSAATDDSNAYRNVEPYPHACLGMVFGKAEKPALPKGKKIMLSLLSWNTKESVLDSLQAYVREAAMLRRLGCEPFIVVCDNGSADGTPEALRELDKKIDLPHEFILNSANKGSSIARNQIIDLMLKRGDDYLMMMDGDVEIVPFSSFAMLRHMEEQGCALGCIGPHSWGMTPQRENASKYLFDLINYRREYLNYVVWTQYGLFRREVFADGIRFDENEPFDGEGWGFEDNDLAFQMLVKNYRIQVFTGMTYLHRNVHSSIRVMLADGRDPRGNYEHRRNYILNKWDKTEHIPPSVISSLQTSQCPQI